MKRWILSKLVTPTRVRRVVAGVLSWLIYTAIAKGTWDAVRAVAAWMRKLADFVESWSTAGLPEEKDRLLYDLVSGAITDEAVDKLLDRVAAMRAAQCTAAAAATEEGNAPVQE